MDRCRGQPVCTHLTNRKQCVCKGTINRSMCRKDICSHMAVWVSVCVSKRNQHVRGRRWRVMQIVRLRQLLERTGGGERVQDGWKEWGNVVEEGASECWRCTWRQRDKNRDSAYSWDITLTPSVGQAVLTLIVWQRVHTCAHIFHRLSQCVQGWVNCQDAVFFPPSCVIAAMINFIQVLFLERPHLSLTKYEIVAHFKSATPE